MRKTNYFLSLFGCEAGGLVRSCNDCPEDEPNRIVHAAFVKKAATVNEAPAQLVASLLALELTCDAYIVRNVNGTMAEATYQTGKGYGKQVNRVLSGTHSITVSDPDVVNNIEKFWNPAIQNAQNYYLYFFTSSLAWKVKKPLSISPSSPITDDITTFIEGAIKIDWSDKGLPIPVKVGEDNVDLLATCPQLFENETGFINASGSFASISTDGYTITLDSGDAVNAYLTSPVALDSVEVSSGTLPSGIEASVSSNGLRVVLSGFSTETGTSTVVLRASNACGVGAEFTVKIVIS